jgi:hypothetical protein
MAAVPIRAHHKFTYANFTDVLEPKKSPMIDNSNNTTLNINN